MNKLIIDKDGTVTAIGDAGTVSDVIADKVKEATIFATYDANGVELTPEIIPDASTLAIEISVNDLKTNAWRLPKARTERLEVLRNIRNEKLKRLDAEYQMADEGVHPARKTKIQVGSERQKLRELPPIAEAALAAFVNTDDIDYYLPSELK